MKKFFFVPFIIAFELACIMICAFAYSSEDKWVEMQCIDIPDKARVHEGMTRNGNEKYWFEFDLIGRISIPPGSAKKYMAGEVTLQLVKWYNKETKEYKYTIRQKRGTKETKNIDLLTIFKQ